MASSRHWFETVAEAQRRAKKRLPKSVYMALVAGSEQGITVNDNVDCLPRAGVPARASRTCRRTAIRPRGCWARTSRSR